MSVYSLVLILVGFFIGIVIGFKMELLDQKGNLLDSEIYNLDRNRKFEWAKK